MQTTRCRPSRLALACAALLGTALADAAPLPLSMGPPNGNSNEPAPNVILSIDDSGSMIERLDPANPGLGRKVELLKQSLVATFGDGSPNSGVIEDGRIRLAWQAMHNNGGAPGADSLTPGGPNSMRPFAGQHRRNFHQFVESIRTGSGTPALRMMDQAFNYLRTPGGPDSPWADQPGSPQPGGRPFLECRRSYHIFLTDGAWNQQRRSERVARGDSVSQTLGNGSTVYDVNSNQTLVYRDSYGDTDPSNPSTLADFAFRGWATDLQDGGSGTAAMANRVSPLIRKRGSQTFSTPNCLASGSCIATQEFWNPRNDPATWQHMVTHTIGFGLGTVNWTFRKNPVAGSKSFYTNQTLFNASGDDNKRKATGADVALRATPVDWDTNNPSKDTFGGDFARLVQGELRWPDVMPENISFDWAEEHIRPIDLWHAAINGRGRYYPVTTPSGLTAAFTDILNQLIKDTSTPQVSIAANTNSLRQGANAYIAGYNAASGTGTLTARAIDPNTGALGAADVWNAGAQLDALNPGQIAGRVVLSYNGSQGIAFRSLGALPPAAQAALNRNAVGHVDNLGQLRLNFLRGDSSEEESAGGPFRDRDSRLGAIVNSDVLYVGAPAIGPGANGYAGFAFSQAGRPPMLYVGASDGMLHGFTASGGQERLAYIPQGIAQGNLRKLTDPNYQLSYLVDGSAFAGNVFLGGGLGWRTLLVGSSGAGSKGYFVLDVTNPNAFSDSTADSIVQLDTTASGDPDIGHIIAPPLLDDSGEGQSRQIVKLNNGRTAVLLGNGVNSSNEAPVLLVQYLDGGRELRKLSPCPQPISSQGCDFKGSANGLSTPSGVDMDGNGTVDVVYAGDLRGQVWKFDLTSNNESSWRTAFSGQPLFVAQRGGQRQPITSAPYTTAHPAGGVMLVVGTGRQLTDADRGATTLQSIYGLRDSTPNGAAAQSAPPGSVVPINSVWAPWTDMLVQQSYNGTPQLSGGSNYFLSTNQPVRYGGADADKGWFLDLPLSGQRVVSNSRAFAGQKVVVESMIPDQVLPNTVETCTATAPSGRRFLSVLNLYTGGPSATAAFVLPGAFSNPGAATMVESAGGQSVLLRAGNQVKELNASCAAGQTCQPKTWNPGQTMGARANWRQILN